MKGRGKVTEEVAEAERDRKTEEFRNSMADRPRIIRRYKDTVFRMLFCDRGKLLELYNAVAGKQYRDADQLKIVTLENAVYLGMKNDLAFLIEFDLSLYEHQSTVNPNMPFRFLQYVTDEYGRLTSGENFYGSRRVALPAPHFVVFYNGTDPQPERQTWKLSEAYITQEGTPQLELQVLVLNINVGFNDVIKEQCGALKEYMEYVDRVRKYAGFLPTEEAVDRAVDECIEEGVLREFLLANKAEVKRMSIYEYDEEATRQAIRETEFERGLNQGMREGLAEGEKAGMARAVIALLEGSGDVPSGLREVIFAQEDGSILTIWLRKAAEAASPGEWMEKCGVKI